MPEVATSTWKALRDRILSGGEHKDKGLNYPPSIPGPYTNPEGASYMRSSKGVFVLVPHNRLAEAVRKGYKPMGPGELALASRRGEKPLEMVPPPIDPTKGVMRGLKGISRVPTAIGGPSAMSLYAASLGTDPMEHPVEAMAEAGSNIALLAPELSVTRRALLSGGGAALGSLAASPEDIPGAAIRGLTHGVAPELLSGAADRGLKVATAGKSEEIFSRLEEKLAARLPRLDAATRKVIIGDIKDWLSDFIASPINEPTKERIKERVPEAVGVGKGEGE